jgi:hypothetical protein
LQKHRFNELKIGVGTIFHNKHKELDRLAHSLSPEGIDFWFLVGGGFKDSPGDPRESDETIDVIENFENEQNKIGSQGIQIEYEYCDGNEFQKRMTYVDMCRRYNVDALVIIDSDEYPYENEEWGIEKNWEKFRRFIYSYLERYPYHSVYSINEIWNEFLATMPYARCWVRPELMTYVQNSHYKFGNPEQDDVLDPLFTHQPTWGVIEGITLKHDHTLRTDEDMNSRREYQDFLVKYEQYLERTDLSDGNPMMARRLALRDVAPFADNCVCMKCFKMKKLTVDQVMDTRPRERREKNPYLTGIPL